MAEVAKNNLKKARETVADERLKIREFGCVVCGESFTLKAALTEHMGVAHGEEGGVACKLCGKNFSGDVDALLRHNCEAADPHYHKNESFENGPTAAKKRKTSRKFKREDAERKADDLKKVILEEMREAVRSPPVHEVEVEEEDNTTTECYTEVTGSTLDLQTVIVAPPPPPPPILTCKFCGKYFFRRDGLREHLRSHDPSQRIKCPDCDETFVWRTTLKRHVRKKHPKGVAIEKGVVRPAPSLNCDQCDLTFEKPSLLKVNR